LKLVSEPRRVYVRANVNIVQTSHDTVRRSILQEQYSNIDLRTVSCSCSNIASLEVLEHLSLITRPDVLIMPPRAAPLPPMDSLSEGEMRALEAQCRAPASAPSRTAVVKLKALPAAGQALCIARYAQYDLMHLVRCALTAGVSADTCWGEDDTLVLCLAAERQLSSA